jgi:hypothetical protein
VRTFTAIDDDDDDDDERLEKYRERFVNRTMFTNPVVFNVNVIRNVYMKKTIDQDILAGAKFLALLHRLSVNDWSLDLEFVTPRNHSTKDYKPQNWLRDALRNKDWTLVPAPGIAG